jgi:biopolymer transport protein TolQ
MFQSSISGLIGSLGIISKVVLVVLFLFSVISWTIILYKWWVLRAVERDDRRFFNTYTRAQDVEEIRRHVRRMPYSPSATVALGVLERAAAESDQALGNDSYGGSRQYFDRVVSHIVQDQISKHEAYLPFLATTGNTTPFIGLLGTVMGIIDAFREIGRQGTASIAAVAPGIAEALVATAAGLFTAIPAVIAYNYFLSRIRRAAFRTEGFSIEFLNAFEAKHAESRTRPVEMRP